MRKRQGVKKPLPAPSKRTLIIMAWTGGILLLLLVLGMLVAIVTLSTDYSDLEDRADHSKVKQETLSDKVLAQEQALAEANRRLRKLGRAPVPTPPVSGNDPIVIVGPAGQNGVNGRDGEDGARGPRGPRGFTGLPGLPGIDGSDGADGTDGTDGTDGRDAFPFTFVFTVPGNGVGGDHTYTCRVPDSGPITCQESSQ